MMIDNDKIGNYIKQLRNINKMTQEELANKLYVSRQAVSNWETGKDVPTVDNVKDICIIFNVSIADIYAGEKVNDIKTLNDIIHGLVTIEMKKSKKIMIISSIIIFVLIIMFLVYYFVTYYNNITAYLIKGDTSEYDINGIMNKSVDNLYFNIELDEKVDKMCLVYKEDKLICESSSNYITFTESNGYNEVVPLNNDSFRDYINNMYLTLENNKNVKKIKLDINQVYINSNLLKEHNKEIDNNDKDYKLEAENIPEKIRKEFNYNKDENSFYLNITENDKRIELLYFVDSNILNIIEDNNKSITRAIYNVKSNVINSYSVEDKNSNIIGEEQNNIFSNELKNSRKKIYNYFKENYIDKYIN